MRYFIEVTYNGKAYGGFQIQKNSNTIQAEIELALSTFYRTKFDLTGSSRTDAGVHAYQNFFHVDTDKEIIDRHVYNINAMLPSDVAIRSIFPVAADAHCRFQATHRTYRYFIYQEKNPFLKDTAWFYPYPLDLSLLNEAAAVLEKYGDFTSFSKRNTQVLTKVCNITESRWHVDKEQIVYTVTANRFLRGMVRGLVGTMLHVGRGQTTIGDLRNIIEAQDCSLADFSTPPHGLFLMEVGFKK